MPTPIIRAAFDIAFSMFDNVPEDHRRAIVDYFLFSSMVRRDGSVLVRNGCIPSGSQFTSIIGTLCNYVVYRCLCRGLDSNLEPVGVKILSDDILMGFNTSLAPAKIRNRVVRHYREFGLKCDAAKTTCFRTSDDSQLIDFLGYLWVGVEPVWLYSGLPVVQACVPLGFTKDFSSGESRRMSRLVSVLSNSKLGPYFIHQLWGAEMWNRILA
jgi:hypothetical protein